MNDIPKIFLVGSIFLIFVILSGSIGHAASTPGPVTTKTEEITLSTSDGPATQADNLDLNSTSCRYGTAAGYRNEPVEWLPYLGAGHYMNFKLAGPTLPPGTEHLPLIKVNQVKENGQYLPAYTSNPPLHILGPYVANNTGLIWIVGNETDVYYADQNGLYPELYARAYHDIYNVIKQNDPTAQVAIAALSMATPGRLQYLDIVWDTYLEKYGEPMPVDVWNTHLYIISEIRRGTQENPVPADGKVALGTDPYLAIESPDGPPEERCPLDNVYCRAEHDDISIFKSQIIALRTWMKAHGQQNKPLILTEFSQLYPFINYDDPVNPTICTVMDEFGGCFTQQRVTDFLNKAMGFLESAKDPALGYPADDNRLVQQWTWYSLWTTHGASGDSSNLLADGYEGYTPGSDSGLTQVGRAYRDRANASQKTRNLVAGVVPTVLAPAVNGKADVELRAGFYNNGTTAIADSFKVTFYKNAALTQVIGTAEISPSTNGVVNGCSWGRTTHWAAVDWSNVPAGLHAFWVKIDSHNQISGETSEADNVARGMVFIGSQILLPAAFSP